MVQFEAACRQWQWVVSAVSWPIELNALLSLFWVVCIVLALLLTSFPTFNPVTKYGKSSSTASGTGLVAKLFVRSLKKNLPSHCSALLFALQNAKVPKSWFKHYYVTAWCICLLLFVVKLKSSWPYVEALTSLSDSLASGPLLALWLWHIHLARRWAECSFLHVWSDATMHVVVLVFGLLHYVGANASLLAAAAAACPPHSAAAWAAPWMPEATLHGASSSQMLLFVLGVLLVAFGQAGQHLAHRQLAALRAPPSQLKPPPSARVAGKYTLPVGGVFSMSSSPHYTFEVCIYAGLTVLTGAPLPMLLLLAWSGTNLALSAAATHAWYKAKFDQTPSPWVIFPGLF